MPGWTGDLARATADREAHIGGRNPLLALVEADQTGLHGYGSVPNRSGTSREALD